jgi:hypothetical protein
LVLGIIVLQLNYHCFNSKGQDKKTGKNLILFSKAVQNKPALKKMNYISYVVILRLLIQNYEKVALNKLKRFSLIVYHCHFSLQRHSFLVVQYNISAVGLHLFPPGLDSKSGSLGRAAPAFQCWE